MRIALRWLILASLLLILAACEPAAPVPPTQPPATLAAETPTPEPTATRVPVIEATPFFGRTIEAGRSSAAIRIIHAAPDSSALDIRLDASELVASLGFGLASGLTNVIPGDYTLTIYTRGQDDVLAETPVTLAAGVTTDVIVLPAEDGLRLLAVNGVAQAIDGSTGVVRAVNALTEPVSARFNDSAPDDLAAGDVTELLTFMQGELRASFSVNGSEILSNTLRLRELTGLTLVLTGTAARPQLLVYETPLLGRYSLRIVNMSAEAREVDVYFDDALVAGELAYQAGTVRNIYANAPAMLYVHAANADIAVSTPYLAGQRIAPRAGTTVTLALYGPVADLRAMWIEQDVSPVPVGMSRVIFAHTLAGVPSLRAGVNSSDLEDIGPFSYGQVSAPVLFDAGEMRLFLRDGGLEGSIVELHEAAVIPAAQSLIYFATGIETAPPPIFGDPVEVDPAMVVDPLATPAGVYTLSFVNALAAQPVIDIFMESAQVVSNLGFGTASPKSEVRTVDFQLTASMSGAGGAVLYDARIGIGDPGDYTIYVFGSPDSGIDIAIIRNQQPLSADNFGVTRLVNLTNDQFSRFGLGVTTAFVPPPDFTPVPTIAPTATAEIPQGGIEASLPRVPFGTNIVVRDTGARQASRIVNVVSNALVYIINADENIVTTLENVPFAPETQTDIVFYEYPIEGGSAFVVFTLVYPVQ